MAALASGLQRFLTVVLWAKILGTIFCFALPLLVLPQHLVLRILGVAEAASPLFLFARLVAIAWAALLVGYFGALAEVRKGRFPVFGVPMGIVSNGGAFLTILVMYSAGQLSDWSAVGTALLLAGAGFAGSIAAALLAAMLWQRCGASAEDGAEHIEQPLAAGLQNFLIMVLWVKILGAIFCLAAPLLLLPQHLILKILGISQAVSPLFIFVRLVAVAWTALFGNYFGALAEVKRGSFPSFGICSGLVSNSVACVWIIASHLAGQMSQWSCLGGGLLLAGAVFVGGIAVGLGVAMVWQRRKTTIAAAAARLSEN